MARFDYAALSNQLFQNKMAMDESRKRRELIDQQIARSRASSQIEQAQAPLNLEAKQIENMKNEYDLQKTQMNDDDKKTIEDYERQMLILGEFGEQVKKGKTPQEQLEIGNRLLPAVQKTFQGLNIETPDEMSEGFDESDLQDIDQIIEQARNIKLLSTSSQDQNLQQVAGLPGTNFNSKTGEYTTDDSISNLYRNNQTVNQQKGKSVIATNPDTGKKEIGTQVFDPKTGETRMSFSPLPDDYQLVNDLGETVTEQTDRRVDETKRKTFEKLSTTDKGELASEGLLAARQISGLSRAEELLDTYVKTGFTDGIKLKLQQMTGTESGDEAELTNTLAKNVLSQLRTVFGSQFTVEEVKRLTKIEPGIGKSTDGNLRIIRQAQKIAQDAAERGMRAAKSNQDDFMFGEIESALNNKDFLSPQKEKSVDDIMKELGL